MASKMSQHSPQAENLLALAGSSPFIEVLIISGCLLCLSTVESKCNVTLCHAKSPALQLPEQNGKNSQLVIICITEFV